MSEEKKKDTKEQVSIDAKSEEVVENEVNEENIEESNNIQISNDVVASIAGMAASAVPGVAEMAGGFAGGISEVLSGKKNMAKGIKVDVEDKNVKVDVNIIVEYGSRIPDVAYEIQNRVKKSVENMTGLKTTEVNVHVQGVSAIKEEKFSNDKEENATDDGKKETENIKNDTNKSTTKNDENK